MSKASFRFTDVSFVIGPIY